MQRIDGKVVWITGASSGIGEALTLALDQRRCRLIISARDEDALNQVKNNCAHSDNIKVLPLDLNDFNNMGQKVIKAYSFFNEIDILVNNAGVSQRSLIIDTELEVYKKLMDINYLGTVALTKSLLPYFIKHKKGHFVTVTSLMGKFGSPYRSGYCGAKHALHGFFDVLRMEHQKDGIEVTLICPGFVKTNVAKNALTADGSLQVKDDVATQNGLVARVFSRKMIRAIERKKFEAYIGKGEVKGIYLKRFFPKLLHRIVLRSQVR
ncbi:MAG: SDR family oxidoreductase [Maribacter sp.]|nr:SDR family oxidoreductase [Maribacter sp.]MBT8315813.1 SDR family oxidoreductase [Maribacter sp.]